MVRMPVRLPVKLGQRKHLKRPLHDFTGLLLWLIPEVRGKWYDYSGEGNDGSITGATKTDGRFHEGLSFDGINDSVKVSDTLKLDIGTSDFSLSAWIKAEAIGADAFSIINKRDVAVGTNRGYQLTLAAMSGKLTAFICDGSAARIVINGTVDLSTNEWINVVATFDRDGDMTIYVNCVKQNSTSISAQQLTIENSIDFNIGREASGAGFGRYFDGEIDDVKCFNKLLSADEREYLCQIGKPD